MVGHTQHKKFIAQTNNKFLPAHTLVKWGEQSHSFVLKLQGLEKIQKHATPMHSLENCTFIFSKLLANTKRRLHVWASV